MQLASQPSRSSTIRVGQLITWVALTICGGLVQAEDELRYVELMPTFVTNFGYEDSGRLSYLKADVSLRVTSKEAEMALRYHLPLLRDALVLLLSRQNEAAVATSAGREQIRLEAIDELQALIVEEEGEPYIKDLMFTNFILQR
jgi:flagellar FliL protein